MLNIKTFKTELAHEEEKKLHDAAKEILRVVQNPELVEMLHRGDTEVEDRFYQNTLHHMKSKPRGGDQLLYNNGIRNIPPYKKPFTRGGDALFERENEHEEDTDKYFYTSRKDEVAPVDKIAVKIKRVLRLLKTLEEKKK